MGFLPSANLNLIWLVIHPTLTSGPGIRKVAIDMCLEETLQMLPSVSLLTHINPLVNITSLYNLLWLTLVKSVNLAVLLQESS